MAVIGVNCTAPEFVADLIREIRAHTEKPVAVYPNLGETYDAADKDRITERIINLVEAGQL